VSVSAFSIRRSRSRAARSRAAASRRLAAQGSRVLLRVLVLAEIVMMGRLMVMLTRRTLR
jgi:hypothetical protein